MFKRKNELPPWPKPPTNDQMLEDILSAPMDDPVFSEFSTQSKNMYNRSNVDVTYEQMRQFLDTSKQLGACMTQLEIQNNKLQESNKELIIMANDIRQQAVDALK